jgi:hypothetical protein
MSNGDQDMRVVLLLKTSTSGCARSRLTLNPPTSYRVPDSQHARSYELLFIQRTDCETEPKNNQCHYNGLNY